MRWCASTTRTARPRPSGPPVTLTELPSAINHHWTKALTASADGRFLYVGIGSNSNITERGMDAEVDRAMVWQIDVRTGAHRPYATGLRNPTALAIQPGTGQLWAVVERAGRDRPRPGAGLPDLGARGRLLRLALQLLGPERRPRGRSRRTRRRSPRRSPRTMRSGSHVAALGLAFSRPGHGRGASPTASSSASTAAGTATPRSATRWSSCPSATASPPASRSTSSPAS